MPYLNYVCFVCDKPQRERVQHVDNSKRSKLMCLTCALEAIDRKFSKPEGEDEMSMNCKICIENGRGATVAHRIVPRIRHGRTENIPMCKNCYEKTLNASTTEQKLETVKQTETLPPIEAPGLQALPRVVALDVDNAPTVREVLEKQQEEESKPLTKPCKCNCGGTLPISSKKDFIHGHRQAMLAKKDNPTNKPVVVNGGGAIGKAIQLIEAEIRMHEEEIAALKVALTPLRLCLHPHNPSLEKNTWAKNNKFVD